MPGPRAKVALKWAGGFCVAYAWLLLLSTRRVAADIELFHTWWWKVTTQWPVTQLMLDRIGHGTMATLASSGVALVLATGLAALVFVARMVVRARVRAGGRDPFVGARSWLQRHASWTRALTAIPAAGLALLTAAASWYLPMPNDDAAPASLRVAMMALWAIPALLGAVAWTAAMRAGVRALVAPVVDASEEARTDIAPSELAFDAVAVTVETRAAVGGMAALGVAMAAWVATLSLHAFYHDARVVAAMAGYAALALGGAALFRRASRVAIGLDGVHVTGTSRTRFFAFREVDDAHARGDDILLVRGTRVVLRLQLHGKDAARRSAVTERLRDAIRRAKDEGQQAATSFVSAASRAELTRVALGAGDYRAAALSPERLWELVEGPAIDSVTRQSAAAALVHGRPAESRARLRVAADRCADPRVRVALQRISEGEELDEEEKAADVLGAARERRIVG